MDKQEILLFLRRVKKYYTIKDCETPEQEVDIAKEWLKVLEPYSAKDIDEALTEYLRNDNRKYKKDAPLLGVLVDIYKKNRNYKAQDKNWDITNLCKLCGGNGYTLVDLPEEEDYQGLGIKCPHYNADELSILKGGGTVKRKLGKKGKEDKLFYFAELDFWLHNDRLFGKLTMPYQGTATNDSKSIEQMRQEQQSFNSFSDIVEQQFGIDDDNYLPF